MNEVKVQRLRKSWVAAQGVKLLVAALCRA